MYRRKQRLKNDLEIFYGSLTKAGSRRRNSHSQPLGPGLRSHRSGRERRDLLRRVPKVWGAPEAAHTAKSLRVTCRCEVLRQRSSTGPSRRSSCLLFLGLDSSCSGAESRDAGADGYAAQDMNGDQEIDGEEFFILEEYSAAAAQRFSTREGASSSSSS